MREVSQLISDYNAVHVVKRVYVDPVKKKELGEALSEIVAQDSSSEPRRELSPDEAERAYAEKSVVASEKPGLATESASTLAKASNGKN